MIEVKPTEEEAQPRKRDPRSLINKNGIYWSITLFVVFTYRTSRPRDSTLSFSDQADGFFFLFFFYTVRLKRAGKRTNSYDLDERKIPEFRYHCYLLRDSKASVAKVFCILAPAIDRYRRLGGMKLFSRRSRRAISNNDRRIPPSVAKIKCAARLSARPGTSCRRPRKPIRLLPSWFERFIATR